jgi:hypothetical protein
VGSAFALTLVVLGAVACGVDQKGLASGDSDGGAVSPGSGGSGGGAGPDAARPIPMATGGAATGGAPARPDGAAATGGAPAGTGGAPTATGGAPAGTGGAPTATGGAPAGTGGAPVPPPDAAVTNPPPPDAAPVDAAPPPPPDAAADTGPPPPHAVLTVGQPGQPGDQAVASRLATLGFQVDVLPVRTREEASRALQAAQAAALVVMSSSMPQGTGFATELRPMGVPIICASPTTLDNLALGEGRTTGLVERQVQIEILVASHPLAAGKSGTVTVTREPASAAWSIPPGGVTRVADLLGGNSGPGGGGDRIALFGVDKGGATALGPAAARRVWFFALEETFAAFNANGWALFDAAVKWASGG